MLGLSPRQVRARIRKGAALFPAERVGSRYRIPREFLDASAVCDRIAVTLFRVVLRRVRQGETPYVNRVVMSHLRLPEIRRDLLAQAEVAARLTRGSPDHAIWKQVYDSLTEAWMAIGVARSGSVYLSGLIDRPELLERVAVRTDVSPDAGVFRDEWVSKTDLVRHVRCPYSFWLLDRGEIAFADTVDDFQRRLLDEGREFQELVESRAVRVHAETAELPQLIREDALLLSSEFRNDELKILGQPDGVDTAGGELLPIEIKSHRHVQRTDELELAFYWLLLEPDRSAPVETPRGFLILRRDGKPEKIEIKILPQRLEEVRRLLDQVRETRRHGARPRICGCLVCNQLRRDEVLQLAWSRKDLTLIVGIGRRYALALEDFGVPDYEALLSHERAAIVGGLRERGCFVSAAIVEQWQHHARSWMTQCPVYFGDSLRFDTESYIVLDIEYDQDGLIWLIGTCLVTGDGREYAAYWSDDRTQERQNLRQLADDLREHPDIPIVTWSGEAADVPRIRHKASEFGLQGIVDEIEQRHRDLFRYAMRGVRLPTTSLSLKDVADYYAVPKVSAIRDGTEADSLYRQYQVERNAKRRGTFREQLIDYNRDDLDALIEVTGHFLHDRGASPA